MPVDVPPLYIGVALLMLPLLLFHKVFCLLQFRFSCTSVNFFFNRIIKGPSTTFNFPVNFFKLCLYYPYCVFCVSIYGVFLGYIVSAAFEGASIVHWWGDKAVGGF